MIIENIALANKRTRAILVKPCMYIMALCVGSRARKLCSFSLFSSKPSEAADEGDYAYYEDPEVNGQGNDEE